MTKSLFFKILIVALLLLVIIKLPPPHPTTIDDTPELPQITHHIKPKPINLSGTYQGPWKTINRKLNGTMTCEVKEGKNWHGRFFGTWQGIDFDYPVDWTGSPEDMKGSAVIDNANYHWTGKIKDGVFEGTFGGDRYNGNFRLTRSNPATS